MDKINQLPKSLFNYISQDGYNSGSIPTDISATRLKDTPRISRLFKMHKDKIKVKVMDRGFAKLGEAWHKVMEENAPSDWICEERFYAEVNGYIISGAIDALEPLGNNTYNIWDYKLMSAYKAKTDMTEFERQLNIYAFLLRKNNKKVNNLYISAIIRDWSENKIREDNYPQTNLPVFQMETWDEKKINDYVLERVEHHTQESMPLCTDEEMWASKDTYAVVSIKTGKAIKIYDSEEDALQNVSVLKNTATVDKRVGDRLRCKRYCEVSQFCDQYKAYLLTKDF